MSNAFERLLKDEQAGALQKWTMKGEPKPESKKSVRRKKRRDSKIPEYTASELPPWSQRPLVIVLRGPYPEKHPTPKFP